MLGIGFPELVVILVLLLVVFKPEQLVELVRGAGGLAERLWRTGQEMREQVEGELRAAEWGRPGHAGDDRSPREAAAPRALIPPPDHSRGTPHRETDDG
jgi:Sec-independent protein translocase protein TatA